MAMFDYGCRECERIVPDQIFMVDEEAPLEMDCVFCGAIDGMEKLIGTPRLPCAKRSPEGHIINDSAKSFWEGVPGLEGWDGKNRAHHKNTKTQIAMGEGSCRPAKL